jgi:hypothetical protein
VEEHFFDHELKELEVHMKQQILEVLLAFISFLHAYDRKMDHIMLVLMFVNVEEIEDLQSQGNVEDLFQTTSTKCKHS